MSLNVERNQIMSFEGADFWLAAAHLAEMASMENKQKKTVEERKNPPGESVPSTITITVKSDAIIQGQKVFPFVNQFKVIFIVMITS